MWLVGLEFVHPHAAKQTPTRYFRAVMSFALQSLLRLAEMGGGLMLFWSHSGSSFQTRGPQCATVECKERKILEA